MVETQQQQQEVEEEVVVMLVAELLDLWGGSLDFQACAETRVCDFPGPPGPEERWKNVFY